MLKSPKTAAGRILKKIAALLMAYCFLATSTWGLNPPGEGLRKRTSFNWASLLAIRSPFSSLASAAGNYRPASGSDRPMPVPKIFTNLADLHASMAAAQATGGATATVSFFGPQQYVRTTGDPNTYTTTVQVPAWVVNPFNLHIQSGEADGSFRVSSATVSINNVAVAVPPDFNQNVFTLDRSVTLTPQTTLMVTLASKPGSYLRINLGGANADHTPPTVTITAPVAAINTPQAHFDIHYRDIVGAGEPAASGVNVSTLQVLIDGVDRTSLFTKFLDEATAVVPASLALAQGPHSVSVSIQDNAGNTGKATEQFQVDTTPPLLQILQPAGGTYVNSTTPQIVLAYSDNFALDLTSLKVTDNGTDITSSFSKTATGASGTPALSQGGNEIVATINDQAGNSTTARITFNVDTTPPAITIVHPSPGSKHGSANVEFQVQYSDDQAIDPNSLVVTVDGTPLAVTPTATGVSGSVTLANSASHVFGASIKDKAGNPASASSTFIVDTTLPNVHILQPALNAILNNPTPQFQVQYSDSISGVDTTTFKASVDGADLTTLFTVGAASASATLQTPLSEGSHTLFAQIASGAGNIGSASNQILIDTIKPQLSIVSPVGAVNTATPLGLAKYSDSGSGVDPASVQVTLDGVDVTGTFGVSSSSASGALGAGAGLSEGQHQFAVKVADKAGNTAQASSPFLVDVTPPVVAFSSPANNSFINNTQPAITLTYADSGSGVDLTSIHVFLQQGSAPETDITSLFAISAGQGSATIPASSALVPGTYHLRAVVADKAGNSAQAQEAFAVDTTPPTYLIQSPAANAFLNTATPLFAVTYQDNSSGVDTSKFVLLVDGVDRTNRLTLTATGASGSLQAADALADGTHQVSVTVVDRAGNAAPVVPQSFLVDTVAPTLTITAPPSAFIFNNHPAVSITYADSGSGVDVTMLHVLIDGADVTSQFAVTPTGATGSPATTLLDGVHSITASIKDLAGNPTTATTSFTVDTTPLQLTVSQPTNGTFTNANSITVSGTVTGFQPVAVAVEGVSVPVAGNAFTTNVPLGPGPTQVIHVTASDPSGANTSASPTVNIDRVPPTIVGSISPPPNAAKWNNSSVTVSFVCADDNSGVASCTGPVPLTNEGAKQTATGTAVDKAGNMASTTVTVNIDKTPPLITATTAPPANANGWNNSNVDVKFFCTDSLSGVASCPAETVVATEGQNQPISGQAVDNAGNVTPIGITLSIDKTSPTIVQLSTPDHISALHGGQVSATVTDNFTVSQVVISVNGNSLGTFTTPPYQANLQVPAGASPGDTLTVTVVATDEAGNTQTSSHGVKVTADGVVVGQVLSDATGLPVKAASVQLIANTGQSDQTDDKGRYSFQASDAHLFLSATNSGSTTVQREIFVQPGAGTVAVDARLTPLAAPVAVGSAGGTLTTGPISISVPAATVSNGTTFQLTPLSGQGLPGLLPLGWSPVAAFDLRASATASQLPAVVSQLPGVVMHLAAYDPALHAWTLVAANLQSVNGACSFTVPTPGAYALVVPDTTTPAIPIPNPGSPLTGVAVVAIDPAAVSTGSLNPPMLPPAGGTATATLGLQSPSFAPSGTVIQANVSETFSLASGDVVSEQTRSEDILLYNALAPANSAMGAQFAVTPSHHYTLQQLVTGKIHLDILAGREGIRGQPGGNDPLTIGDGIATLSVPGGALSQDTAISVQSTSLENFVPTSSTMGAIQEVLVDFSGELLTTPAQLSISSTGLNPSHTFLLTQIQRINGVPNMVAVALAQINGTTLSSVASPGLPGVTQGGEYVFYDISAPVGFVQGVTSSTAGPVPALVLTDSLQIASISGADGHYIVPALAGPVNLKASAPNTSLAGTASAQAVAGQTVTINILLAGAVTRATVTPADGTLGVSASTIITITTSAPLNPQSIAQGNLSLFKGPAAALGAPVPLQPFVLSTSGTALTFAPVANLDPATQYTIKVSGLADASGNAIAVPTSSFTTKATAPLNFDPNAITFAFPDANGNIHVSAPAGSLPSGTQVLIIDQTTAVVVSFTSLNDGSLSGDFPGTINDVLQVSVTAPSGANASFTRSQFVAADGSVAVGSGGGTVTGPGGVELRIPAGALDKAATFKIQSVGPDVFPERPDLPGATFGSGLKISSPDQPTFKQEVRLAFPMPAGAPPGAFFQVYRKLIGSNSQFAFEDVDYAKVEAATGKVVTASFPYRGLIDLNVKLSDALFQGQLLGGSIGGPAVTGGLDNVAILMWTIDQLLPGVALGGAITGRVRYAVPPGGTEPDGTINKTGQTVFAGVPNVTVHVDTNTSTHALGSGQTVAMTQPDGTFTFSDPNYHGGTINLVASDGTGHSATASAIEVVSVTDLTVEQFAGPILPLYRNVAFADMVLPAPAPPPPTPQISINVFTENPNSTPRGLRMQAPGLLTTGAPYVLAFKTTGQIQNVTATINGLSYPTQADQPIVTTDPNTLDFEVAGYFTPGNPGPYTITVTGLTAFNQPITVSKSVMAIAPGGNNNSIKVGVAPIIATVIPAAGSNGVPVDTFVQVFFNEPVTNLAGNVSLVPGDGSAPPPIRLSGFSYLDASNSNPITNLSATDKVSSVTIQPLLGLKFNTKYTVKVTTAVVNLDNVADPTKQALSFVPPENQNPPVAPYDFTTFGPIALGGTAAFGSTRAVVLGNRAYVALPALNSQVETYDISDPINPVQVLASTTSFIGRAMDIAGEQNADVIGGGNLIAVMAGFASGNIPIPSNLWLYNVSGDQMTRVGGISVTASAINVGQGVRLAVKGNFAYVSVVPGGIEVVDLGQGISDYAAVFNSNPVQFGQGITTDGEGFANDAVVNTIPVKDANGVNVYLWGIKAGDFVVAGSDPLNPLTQTLVVATGNNAASPTPVSFVVADPSQSGSSAVIYSNKLQLGTSTLTSGNALTLGQLTDSVPDASGNPVVKPVAVVVGYGSAPDPNNAGQTSVNVLAVVDMTTPSAPVVLSMIGLPTVASDVLLNGTMALVGTYANEVLLVNLIDPRKPVNAGTITSSRFGDRLALSDEGILLGTSFNSTTGGLQTALVSKLALVDKFNPPVILVDASGKTAEPFTTSFRTLPAANDDTNGQASRLLGQSVTGTTPLSLIQGVGQNSYPLGLQVNSATAPNQIRFDLIKQGQTVASGSKNIPLDAFYVNEQNGPFTVTADNPTLDLGGTVPGMIQLASQNTPTSKTISWKLVGAGSLDLSSTNSTNGLFANNLTMPTKAGAQAIVQFTMPGSALLAQSAPITVVPGLAANVQISADRTSLPADTLSTSNLTLTATDAAGNPIADGSIVVWTWEQDGIIVTNETPTQGGTATTVFTVGSEPGLQAITATIDTVVQQIQINAAPLSVQIQVAKTSLQMGEATTVTLSVTSAAGPPLDGLTVSALGAMGTLSAFPPLVSGQTQATFTAGQQHGSGSISVSVPGATAEQVVTILPPSTGAYAVFDQPYIIGNHTTDGTVMITGGDFQDSYAYSYRTSTNVRILGGTPGTTVHVKLGNEAFPNVEPLFWLLMNDLGSVANDFYHDHPGSVTGGVSLDQTVFRSGGGSYKFDGTGLITIPSSTAFDIPTGIEVYTDLYLGTVCPNAQLISRSGAFGFRTVQNGSSCRLRFGVSIGGQLQEIEYPVDLALGQWMAASGSYVNGLLSVTVDGKTQSQPLSGNIDASQAAVLIGSNFVGNLDNTKVFDLNHAGIAAFADGTTQSDMVFDQNGIATQTVVSLGNLRTASPNSMTIPFEIYYQVGPVGEILKKIDYINAIADKYAGYLEQFVKGILIGDTSTATAIVGSIIGSFIPIFGDARDLIIALYDIHKKRGNRAFNAAIAVVCVIGLISTIGLLIDLPLELGPEALKVVLRGLKAIGISEELAKVVLEVITRFLREPLIILKYKKLFTALLKPSNIALLRELEIGTDLFKEAKRFEYLAHLVNNLPSFETALNLLLRIKNLGTNGPKVVERVMEIVGENGLKWSEQAIEGMGVFGNLRIVTQGKTYLEAIINGAPNAAKEQFFELVLQASKNGVEGLITDIRKISTVNGAKGLFHKLYYLNSKGLLTAGTKLEQALGAKIGSTTYRAVIDAFVNGERFEFKNVADCSSEIVDQFAKLMTIYGALGLKERVRYVFRGSRSPTCAAVVNTMFEIANRTLGKGQTIFAKAQAEFLNLATDF